MMPAVYHPPIQLGLFQLGDLPAAGEDEDPRGKSGPNDVESPYIHHGFPG